MFFLGRGRTVKRYSLQRSHARWVSRTVNTMLTADVYYKQLQVDAYAKPPLNCTQ